MVHRSKQPTIRNRRQNKLNNEDSIKYLLNVILSNAIPCMKIRYSIEPRDKIYVKGYIFFSFAKNMGRHANKVAKSLSNKYSQKLLDSAKKSTMDAIKTASKRAIQKTAEATGDLIGNKIADKMTSVSKKIC